METLPPPQFMRRLDSAYSISNYNSGGTSSNSQGYISPALFDYLHLTNHFVCNHGSVPSTMGQPSLLLNRLDRSLHKYDITYCVRPSEAIEIPPWANCNIPYA